jgi:hypothetical protein
MDISVRFDLLIGGGLIAGLIAAEAWIRSARVIVEQNGSPAAAGRVRRSDRAVAVLWTFRAGLVLLAFLNLAYFRPGANRVVGSPTRAQVTGTWGGDYGLGLVLRPDGTFTSAALPPHVGTAAPVLSSAGTFVLNAWPAHGTWTIGPGEFNGSPASVIFTVACGAASAGCAGHPRTFELQLETNSPDGGGGPALFYYLGSPRDLSNQYPFVRADAGWAARFVRVPEGGERRPAPSGTPPRVDAGAGSLVSGLLGLAGVVSGAEQPAPDTTRLQLRCRT